MIFGQGPQVPPTPPEQPKQIVIATNLEIELELDPEWQKVRRYREGRYEAAGIGEFTAFRLALDPEIDWHKVVAAKEKGLSDDGLVDLFLD